MFTPGDYHFCSAYGLLLCIVLSPPLKRVIFSNLLIYSIPAMESISNYCMSITEQQKQGFIVPEPFF